MYVSKVVFFTLKVLYHLKLVFICHGKACTPPRQKHTLTHRERDSKHPASESRHPRARMQMAQKKIYRAEENHARFHVSTHTHRVM